MSEQMGNLKRAMETEKVSLTWMIAEERICELKDRLVEISNMKNQEGKN